jgi:hypothetical protein
MRNYGIPVLLAGVLTVLVGAAWEATAYILATRLLHVTAPWWMSYPAYVLFWGGVIIFAIGAVLTIIYALINVWENYELAKTRVLEARIRSSGKK